MRHVSVAIFLFASVAHAGRPKLAAHVAPMFEKGRTWVYDTSLTFWGPDGKSKKTEREKVTCKVVEVTAKKGFLLSHVTCDKESSMKFRVPGYYVGTAAGLWHSYSDEAPTDEDLAAWLAGPPTIATAPKVFEKVSKAGGPDPKHDTIIEGLRTSPKTNGWCTYDDSSRADVDGGRIVACYAPGIGFESGYNDVGGELNRFEYRVR